MRKMNGKKLISLILLLSFLCALLPLGVLSSFKGIARAEGEKQAEDNAWKYTIDADGYACVIGYADESVLSLTIPKMLGGAYVAKLAQNAFLENPALEEITVPASVSEIPETAFSEHEALTVCAPMGSKAMEFAKMRGYFVKSTSAFDFLTGIKDLSEMTQEQFEISGMSGVIENPYAKAIKEGDKLFLPATDVYPNGLPVEVSNVRMLDSEAHMSFRILEFTQVIETYAVTNVPAKPDTGRMVILEEGFTLVEAPKGRAIAGSIGTEVSFAIDYDTGKGKSISGKLSYEPNYEFSLSYKHFKLEEFSYTNKSKTSLNVTYKDAADVVDKKSDPDVIKFAKLPLTTPSLVSVWLELSLVVSVEGEVTLETSMTTTETMTWTPERGATSSKTKSVDYVSASAAIGVSVELKMAILVNLGFSATDFNLDIAELSVSVGAKANVKFLDSEVDCKELDVDGIFTVSVKLGILSSDKPNVSLNMTLFSLKWDALTLHMEFNPFKIVRECTKDVVTVSFSANGGVNAPNSVTMKRDSLLKDVDEPTRSGYVFTGWYTDAGCGVLWQMENDPVTESMTLYAGWEEIKPDATPTPTPVPDPELQPVPNIPAQSASASLPYLKYLVGADSVTITGFTGSPETLTIPSMIEGLPVKAIGSGAFNGCNSLKRVVIPYSVEKIDSWAFLQCKSLVIADIPSSLKTMGSSCFSGCTSLLEAYIPGKLEVIGVGMFYGCSSLQTANIGSGLPFLPGTTFENCDSLVEVSLPSTLESIEGSAFYDCDALQEIRLPAGLKKIGTSVFSGCGKLRTVNFPSSLESIGSSAFHGTALTEVRLQGALETMGSSVFSNCGSLKKVYFACPLEILGSSSFANCTVLEEATLPNSLVKIDGMAFEKCKALKEIRFPSTLTEIGDNAFNSCTSLEKAEMQFGLTQIGSNAFNGCTLLKAPDFPYTLKEIKTGAFKNCDAMETVELYGDDMTVGYAAFKECDGLKTLILTGIKLIDTYSFDNCKALENVTINSLNKIGAYAFNNCDTLKEILLPEGLVEIGDSAFSSCNKLKTVSFPSSLEKIGGNAFNNCALEEVRISGSLKTMGSNAFTNCTALTSVTLNTPKLTCLSYGAFKGCTALTNVALPDAMTMIDTYAFNGCSSLTDVVWPTSLTTIELEAFRNCSGLKKLHLPEGLTTIKNSAFSNCLALEDLRLPGSLTTLGSSVFYNCTALKQVRVPNKITSNNGYTFQNCTSLTSVTLAEGLTKIANSMFSGCSSLVEVIIPDSVTTIEASAFYRCTKLPYITIGTNVASIGSGAFDSCSSFTCVYVYTMECAAYSYFEAKYPKVVIALVGDRVTIQFDTMGGSFVPGTYSAPGALVAMPEEPEKEDYTFKGWYLDRECTDMWLFPVDKVPAGGMTLYAGWNYTPKDMKYVRNGEGVTLTDYSGDKSVLEIPEELNGYTVTGIGKEALNEKVTVVHIPACVTDISSTAFRWAENLTTITVDEGNTAYYAKDGVLYAADGTLVCYPRGRTAVSFTPGEGTFAIGDHAFYDVDGINKLVIPSSVKSMGAYAVYDCDALKEVVFEGDLTPGNGCFMFCHRELDITGPKDAPKLAEYADKIYLNFNEYNVIFKENGELLGSYRVRAGKLVGEPPRPDDGEMTFVGWSETGKENDLWNFAATPMPEKDLTLNAVWRWDFTVRAKDGGVEIVDYKGDKTVVQVPEVIDGKKVVSIADDCFPDENVTITGNSGSVAEEWAKKKGMTFVALKYTVTFIPCGGTQPPALTLSAGQKVPAPKAFREGYILSGWYTDKYFSNRFDFDNHLMPGHDLTLYASWTKESDAAEIPFTYEESGEGLTITGYIGAPGAAAIPETINGMPVIAIAPYAFHENKDLMGLTIPGSVKTVGEGALSQSAVTFVKMESGVLMLEPLALADCEQLTELILPDTIHTLGHHALQGLSALPSLTLPVGVTELPEGLLSGCTFLEKVDLPAQLSLIGKNAFKDCPRLQMIALPGTVHSVSNSAFGGCSSLAALTADSLYFRSVDGVLLTADGKTLVLYPQGKTDKVWTIPEGVEIIADNAMNGAGITELTLPDSVASVGKGALRSCAQLEKLNAGSGLKMIQSDALSGCMSLKEVRLNASANLASGAIPALKDLTIYAPIASFAQTYASENGIRFVPELRWETYLPKGLTQIKANSFMGTAVLTVYCPDGLSVIGDNAFKESALMCVRIPESVNKISDTAFDGLPALVIVAPAGSEAERYAQRMGISFIAE